jgi:hypothetical protein
MSCEVCDDVVIVKPCGGSTKQDLFVYTLYVSTVYKYKKNNTYTHTHTHTHTYFPQNFI